MQDEFRQWFRARLHVISAPGKTPFQSVDPQFVAQLPSRDGSIQELGRKSGERQPVQVPQRYNRQSTNGAKLTPPPLPIDPLLQPPQH